MAVAVAVGVAVAVAVTVTVTMDETLTVIVTVTETVTVPVTVTVTGCARDSMFVISRKPRADGLHGPTYRRRAAGDSRGDPDEPD